MKAFAFTPETEQALLKYVVATGFFALPRCYCTSNNNDTVLSNTLEHVEIKRSDITPNFSALTSTVPNTVP